MSNPNAFRKELLPIAIVEHHQMVYPALNVYDICDRLGLLSLEVRREAQTGAFTLEAACVAGMHARVARALGVDGGPFRNPQGWADLVGSFESITEDPAHIGSWIFSSLYWDHLTGCRLSTAFLFTNAIRIQHQLPEYRLDLGQLGAFLCSLSGAGPPIYDGQHFYPEYYCGQDS